MRPLGCAVALAALFLARPVPAAAQWGIAVEVGAARFGGTSRDSSGSPDSLALRPYHATAWGLVVSRGFGRARLDLAVRHAAPGIAGDAKDFAFVFKGDAEFLEVAPGVSVALFALPGGARLRAEAAPAVTFWRITGAASRVRWGGEAALAYEWPIAPGFEGVVRAGLAASPSVLEADELPPELRRRATWRRTVSLRVRWLP